MTAVAVAFDGTRMNNADTYASPPWYDSGGKAAVTEPDLVYQGSASVSEKVSTTQLGVGYYQSGTVDMTTPKVAMIKVTISNLGLLNNEGSTGAIVDIGSNQWTSNYHSIYVRGKDTWPPTARWLFAFVDPNEAAYRDATNGTPALASTNWFCFKATFTGGSKAENVAMDAIEYVNSGKGLTLDYGNGADAPGNFASFIAWDETTTTNRYGVVYSNAGVVFCNLMLTIGTANATEFTSENEQVIFPKLWVGVGAQGITFDLQNASTIVSLASDVFASEGVDNLKRYFDTELQIDNANDEIDITAHGYSTGQYLLYSKGGDSGAIGLTDGSSYWVRAITVDSIALYATRQAAMTGGTKVALTPVGSGLGKNHSLRRAPMTTPVLTVTGTSGSMAITGCNFIRFSTITSTSKPTWTSCKFVNPWNIVIGGADFTSCTFGGAMTTEGESLISSSPANIGQIASSDFIAGAYGGHAIEITGTAANVDLAGVGFSGYGPDPEEGSGHSFVTDSTGVDATNDYIKYTGHAFTTGDPVYYSKYDPDDGTLGTAAIGLTNGGLYYVRNVDANNFSLHYSRYAAVNNSNKIGLSTSGAEHHTFYSADAAVCNNTGGSLTINVSSGDTPSIRNIGAATTTVAASITVTVTPVENGSEVRAYLTGTSTEVDGEESASGGSVALTLSSGVAVDIVVLCYNPPMVPVRIENQSFTASQDFNPQQRPDLNYSNP